MKSHVKVAVIGGGVVGASVLYHLTKKGWRDVALIERSELTSGSTWHAAGGMHTLNGDPNVAQLQQYTISLYKEIEAISGQSCGAHMPGGVMLAGTPERMQFLKMAHARGRYLGIDTELISVAEAKNRFPFLDETKFIGAMWDAAEGHVDPYGVTHAYAKAARMQGAEVYLRNRVIDLKARPDGTWDVVTEEGTIHAEHVVNCGGLWAREVGRMVGLELPILAMEHMYILTEDMPEVAEINARTGEEVPMVLDFEGEIYIRQERGGLLLGTYEKACRPWSERETPWSFGHELLEPDLERIAPSLEVGFQHYPIFQRTGIRKVVNGPFTFAPDGNPLVGPVRGLKNFWVACGVMAGFSQGGGVGLALSNWMVDGDPGFDIWGMDVSRFGSWATLAYTNAKVRENYSRRFSIRFPNEELPAARPLQTTPVHDQWLAANAVMGDAWGLETPQWFAPPGTPAIEDVTFERSNAFPHIAHECRAVRERVGVSDTSFYAKYEIKGPGAEAWLRHLLAGRIPAAGRIVLTPMLNEQGRLIGDFTLARLDAETFYIFGSGYGQVYHMRWFEAHLPQDGSVSVRALGPGLTGLSFAGPNAQALLQKLTIQDVSTKAFPFMSFRRMDLGMIPALVGRISFTGDLGYEVWVTPEYMRGLRALLLREGAEFGIAEVGVRAVLSLRLEKGWGIWLREYRPIYGPTEAALERFLDFNKGDFIGREAALKEKQEGPKRRLVTFTVDVDGADVIGDEPIWHDNAVVGWITSGGYAHHAGASVALGYVPAKLQHAESGFEIEILGERRPARIQPLPLYDPQGGKMRG